MARHGGGGPERSGKAVCGGLDPGVDLPHPVHGGLGRHLFAFPRPAAGQFDHPVRKSPRPDGDPPRQADQVHRRELRPGPFVTVDHGRIAAASSIELRVGDDVTTRANSEIIASTSAADTASGIVIRGDYLNSDTGQGTHMVLRGSITPGPDGLTEIFGNADVDSIRFVETFLGGWTRAYGSAVVADPVNAAANDGQILVAALGC